MVWLSVVFVMILVFFVFFFDDTATTESYTLSLHDALPDLSVVCNDTLEYGKYLSPANPDEKNRRAYNTFAKDNNDYYLEIPSWNFIANTKTPTVWLAFKWFGPQTVTIYAGDYNFLRWFMQASNFSNNESDPLKYSVNNAIGVFGSAIKLSGDFFLFKNQP